MFCLLTAVKRCTRPLSATCQFGVVVYHNENVLYLFVYFGRDWIIISNFKNKQNIDLPSKQRCDFTCSVSEFTSSTGSFHMFLYVNSLYSVKKFGVLTHVYREIMSFSRDDTYH